MRRDGLKPSKPEAHVTTYAYRHGLIKPETVRSTLHKLAKEGMVTKEGNTWQAVSDVATIAELEGK